MNRRPFARKTTQRGFTAIEVAIFMIAATVVATFSAIALLTLSGDSAQAGAQAANRGLNQSAGAIQVQGPVIATRGEVDVDGNDVINLGGSDIEAITKLTMILTTQMTGGIEFTPPYTVDNSGTEPDFSTTQISTVISVITENFSAASAAWSITFPGDDDGDALLDKGERAEVTIWLFPEDSANGWFDLGTDGSDPYIDSADDALIERGQLTIRIMPDGAPETSLIHTLPLELTATVLLE